MVYRFYKICTSVICNVPNSMNVIRSNARGRVAQRWLLIGLLLFVTSLTTPGFAQLSESNDVMLFDEERDLADQLLPFENLYQIALHHSPAIRQEDASLESQVAANQMAKWSLLRGLSLSTGYSASNQSVVPTADNPTQTFQLSNGYRFGISAGFSIGDLVTRHAAAKQLQAAYKQSQAKREMSVQQLRQQLHHLYQNTLLSQRLLKMAIQNQQAALVAYQTAEINMKQGRLSPTEYAGALKTYTGAQIEVESSRTTVLTNLFDLITVIGVPVARLRNAPK